MLAFLSCEESHQVSPSCSLKTSPQKGLVLLVMTACFSLKSPGSTHPWRVSSPVRGLVPTRVRGQPFLQPLDFLQTALERMA